MVTHYSRTYYDCITELDANYSEFYFASLRQNLVCLLSLKHKTEFPHFQLYGGRAQHSYLGMVHWLVVCSSCTDALLTSLLFPFSSSVLGASSLFRLIAGLQSSGSSMTKVEDSLLLWLSFAKPFRTSQL